MASGNNAQGILSIPPTYLETMKASPKYKWLKPLLALVLFVIFYFAFSVILGIIQEFFGYDALGLKDALGAIADSNNYLDDDLTDPLQVFFMSMMVGVMIPAAGLAAKITGLGGVGSLSSVENRFRWGRFAKLALPLFLLTCVFTVVIPIIGMVIDGETAQLANPQIVPVALITMVLFVPIQCAGEEYAFRGLIQQALGSWIPVPVVVILLQSLAFAAMHGYDLLGNFGIMISGIIWGWLAIKTGGLEATTCLHAANNVSVMAMSTLFVSSTVTKTTELASFFLDTGGSILLVIAAYYLCKRFGYLEK